MDDWVESELDGGEFPDHRLKTRLGKLLGDLGRRIGATVPMACQDWAATKAAYRFFSNRRVDEGLILAGHFAATRARFARTTGPTLVLRDTTEFSYKRDSTEAIGQISIIKGQHGSHTLCGVLMHSSLVLTSGGVPLGLAAVKFWTREKFKGTNALKKSVNPTRIPIEQKESVRWLENLKQSTQQLGDPTAEIRLPGRAVQASRGRATDQSAGHALHHRLACLLADDDESSDSRGAGRGCLDVLGSVRKRLLASQTQRSLDECHLDHTTEVLGRLLEP